MLKGFFAVFLITSSAFAQPCPYPWVGETTLGCDTIKYQTALFYHRQANVSIRAGTIIESRTATFRGNVLYFEGLGDSMLNHLPLFTLLTENGYRVIAFDYMGQGGSTGFMNDTRIKAIPDIGDVVYQRLARDPENSKKFILGWSTGGLAGYYEASRGRANAVALIAPGISPKKIVGKPVGLNWETLPWDTITGQPYMSLEFLTITLDTLTNQPYMGVGVDPHVDPIKPDSPRKVFWFALDLMDVSDEAKTWHIPSSVPGLVLLSDPNDSYVDAGDTKNVLSANAPHFKTIDYPGALHEIDNEIPSISVKARHDIVDFFNSVSR